MTGSSETKYSELLELWNSLSDTSNDKIKYLAMFDGDEEKAKWAFIRDGVKPERKTKFSLPKFSVTSTEQSPTFAKKIISGDIPFWRSYLALIVVPNILFKVLLANQSLTVSGLKAVLSLYYVLSMVAVILLTASAFKLHKEANKYAKIALGLMLLSVGSIIYQTPSVINVFSTSEKSNQSKNDAKLQQLFGESDRTGDCLLAAQRFRDGTRWGRDLYWQEVARCNDLR